MLATYYAHIRPPRSWPSKSGVRLSFRPTANTLSTEKEMPLPEEALLLKNLICKTHPAKCFSFSLAHMRKVAVPPVEIPVEYRNSRAKSMQVGGRQVPYTREMWRKSKRRIVYRRLDSIHEYVTYQ